MAEKRATLYALMRECAATERSVANLWAWGRKHVAEGTAMPAQLGLVDVLSQRLFLQQQAILAPIHTFITGLPQTVRVEITSRLPQHQALPRLAAGTGAAGFSGAGLGAVPLVIGGVAIPTGALIIGALLALAVTIAVLYFFYANTEMFGDIVQDVQALRADAADAQRRLAAQQARYQDCLNAGGTPQSCASLFPIPEPTTFYRDRQENDLPPWAIGLASIGGLVAVAGLLYVGIRAYTAASPYRALKEVVT